MRVLTLSLIACGDAVQTEDPPFEYTDDCPAEPESPVMAHAQTRFSRPYQDIFEPATWDDDEVFFSWIDSAEAPGAHDLEVYRLRTELDLLYTISGDGAYAFQAAPSGDWSGDGQPDLAVATVTSLWSEGTIIGESGAIYLYESPLEEALPDPSRVVDGGTSDGFAGPIATLGTSVIAARYLASSGGLIVIPSDGRQNIDRSELDCTPAGLAPYFGVTLAEVGDSDGDGWEDLLVSSLRQAWLVDGLALLDGCAIDAEELELPWTSGGLEFAALGDTDGDGLGDVAVANDTGAESRLALFTHPGEPVAHVVRPGGWLTGADVAPAGDQNGDGLADILFSSASIRDVEYEASVIYLLPGTICGNVDPTDFALAGLGLDEYGTSAAYTLSSWGDTFAFGKYTNPKDGPGQDTLEFYDLVR